MIGSVLIFLLVLSLLILVHEFGHYIVAKRSGILVEEFGIGLPPRLFGKKIGETIYSINLLPFGGFVRLHGESSEEEIVSPKRAFMKKPKKVRLAVIMAGVVMNFLLGVVAFAVLYSFLGIPKETTDVKIVEVNPGSPAQVAGFTVGDIVRKVDGKGVSTNDEFVSIIEEKKGRKVSLDIERNLNGDKTQTKITITPRENPPEEEGPLGVVITTTEIYFPPFWQRPFVGAFYGFKEAVGWGGKIAEGFIRIFKDLFKGITPTEVAGPVGIYALTTQAAKGGLVDLVNFIGFISINLAILNIIPFPGLDGGRLLFIAIESISGKPVLPKVEAAVHTAGIIVLLTLLLALTVHDIRRLVNLGSVSNFVESVIK
jgi:regulator of sigma E protease